MGVVDDYDVLSAELQFTQVRLEVLAVGPDENRRPASDDRVARCFDEEATLPCTPYGMNNHDVSRATDGDEIRVLRQEQRVAQALEL
jgi:hypothetical protein